MKHLNKVLRLSAGAGEELIRCGAEIARVEETMNRIAAHYGATKRQVYIIANGVFVSLEMGEETKTVSIENIPNVSVDLDRLCELNRLSRDIEKDDLDIDEALNRFEEIKKGKKKNPWANILASGVGSAAFCALFGGQFRDCLAVLLMGILVWSFFLILGRLPVSKVLLHIAGSFLVTAGCIAMYHVGLVSYLNTAIMGSIIPMIPGVAMVNGVRDIADGNYISGAIRLLDAILIFTCIATGVYLAMHIGGRF